MHLVADIRAIADLRPKGSTAPVAIDVPIGLLETVAFRDCDRQARKRLGHAANSVFAPPARYMLPAARDYTAIRALVAELRKTQPDAKSISAQAAGIAPKIAAVDAYVRSTAGTEAWLFECHPELSFAALNAGEPFNASKHSASGLIQRLLLLRETFPDIEQQIAASPWPGKHAALSDSLDAYAALSTAVRCAVGEHDVIGDGQRDSAGILMRMVV